MWCGFVCVCVKGTGSEESETIVMPVSSGKSVWKMQFFKKNNTYRSLKWKNKKHSICISKVFIVKIFSDKVMFVLI